MSTVHWDKWDVVQEAIGQRGTGSFPLVAILWAQTWNPPSLHSAESMENIRTSGALSDAQLFVVDIDQNVEKAMEYDVTCTPALLLFWKGEQVDVRRCFRADTTKFVGSVKEAKWMEIVKEGLAAGKRYDEGETFLRACFEF